MKNNTDSKITGYYIMVPPSSGYKYSMSIAWFSTNHIKEAQDYFKHLKFVNMHPGIYVEPSYHKRLGIDTHPLPWSKNSTSKRKKDLKEFLSNQLC